MEPPREPAQETGKAKSENGEAETKRSQKFLFLLAFIGFLLAAGGLGTAGYLEWTDHPGGAGFKRRILRASPSVPTVGPMIKLAPLIINLRENSGDHYIKTTLVLEIGQKDWLEEVQAQMPSLTDRMILTLGDKKLEELRKPEHRDHLKRELLDKANQLFSSGKSNAFILMNFSFSNRGNFFLIYESSPI